MKKILWVEITYSNWRVNSTWEIETKNTWLIPLPNLSKDLEKTDFTDIVNNILKK